MKGLNKRLLLLPVIVLLFASCRSFPSHEPEQVYLISAFGFDARNGRLRVCAEVPLTRENEADKMEVRLFEGVGDSPRDALRKIETGLSKELLFGHCALVILGDGLTSEQHIEILQFLATGKTVPVSAPDAHDLLGSGSLSAPAAGYEIPGILRGQMDSMGMDPCCRLYEISASPAGSVVAYPRFLPANEETGESDCFDGLRFFRDGKAIADIRAEDCVAYALLSGRFSGCHGSVASLGGAELGNVRRRWQAEWRGDSLILTLKCGMSAFVTLPSPVPERLAADLQRQTEALFAQIARTTNADVFGIAEQLKLDCPNLPHQGEGDLIAALQGASLRVVCRVEGKESGKQ